jgi:L-threonylcarbamoyladenylate synthase
MTPPTQNLLPDDAGLASAAQILHDGALVAFPTETVYGLGADARQGEAVAAIYAAKDRPSFNPLIVHVADITTAQKYVDWPDHATKLAQAFWPGPLTLVLPLRAEHDLSPLVTAGLSTVGIRIPAHPIAHALLKEFGGPVAAPSANPSGRISPTTAEHVLAGLDHRIAAMIDGGPCDVGLESTIIGFDKGCAVLLRAGGLPSEQIEAVLGAPLVHNNKSEISAPGQMASHYAPRGAVRLNSTSAHPDEHMLGFGTVAGTLTLSASGDLVEAAANLFGHLHRLDALGGPIAVAPIPMEGLGQAINDRLNRAAAPRD